MGREFVDVDVVSWSLPFSWEKHIGTRWATHPLGKTAWLLRSRTAALRAASAESLHLYVWVVAVYRTATVRCDSTRRLARMRCVARRVSLFLPRSAGVTRGSLHPQHDPRSLDKMAAYVGLTEPPFQPRQESQGIAALACGNQSEHTAVRGKRCIRRRDRRRPADPRTGCGERRRSTWPR